MTLHAIFMVFHLFTKFMHNSTQNKLSTVPSEHLCEYLRHKQGNYLNSRFLDIYFKKFIVIPDISLHARKNLSTT